MTDPSDEDIYSGVVGMETVRICFTLARLNELEVCAGDIGNAYLYGKTKEKVYVIAGPEFGHKLLGKRLLIDKALYGLKSSSARFHEHLSATLLLLKCIFELPTRYTTVLTHCETMSYITDYIFPGEILVNYFSKPHETKTVPR